MRSRGILLAFACLFASCRPEPAALLPQGRIADTESADCSGGILAVGPSGRYQRITDALAHARDLRLRAGVLERASDVICIVVASGRHVGTFDPEMLASHLGYEAFPLIVDVPGIAIRGATQLVLDEHDRPMRVEADATTLIADPPATDQSQAYILVTTTERTAGESRIRSRGNDAHIEGLVLSFAACGGTGSACSANVDCFDEACELTRRGAGIWAHHVQDFTVRGNAVIGAGNAALQHSFASGRTIGNLLMRNSPAGIVLRGPAPGRLLVRENTSTDNAVGGMASVCAAGNFPLPTLAHERGLEVVLGPVDGSLERTDVEIDANDFSRHGQDLHFSFGLRVMMFGPALLPSRRARCAVTVTNNRMRDTSFGLVTDAAFPFQTRDGVRVDAVWNAELEARYEGNDIESQTEDALISFTRFTSTRDCGELDATRPDSFQFLRDSRYIIESDLASVCYDNRALDPSTGEALGNELRIDGAARTGLSCAPVVACN